MLTRVKKTLNRMARSEQWKWHCAYIPSFHSIFYTGY